LKVTKALISAFEPGTSETEELERDKPKLVGWLVPLVDVRVEDIHDVVDSLEVVDDAVVVAVVVAEVEVILVVVVCVLVVLEEDEVVLDVVVTVVVVVVVVVPPPEAGYIGRSSSTPLLDP